jgi:tight adherence protein C
MPQLTVHFFTLKYTSMGATALGVAVMLYTLLSAPTRVANRLGLRGLKRQRALQNNELWAQIEPLVRWLGVRVSGIPTDEQRKKIDAQISLAGDVLGLTADEFIALSIVSSVSGLVIGALLGYLTGLGGIAAFMLGIGGAALPYMQLTGIAQERMKSISRGLPYAIDLLALSMGAGLDFPGAVRQVVEKSSNPEDPIVEEYTLMLQTLGLGRTRKEALTEFAARAPVDAVQEFVNAVVQAEERGNPVAEVLSIQANVSRTRRSVRAEELAAKAGVAMVGPLMLIFFTVLGLLLGPAILTIMEKGF